MAPVRGLEPRTRGLTVHWSPVDKIILVTKKYTIIFQKFNRGAVGEGDALFLLYLLNSDVEALTAGFKFLVRYVIRVD